MRASPRQGGARLAERSEQVAGEGFPKYTDRGTLYRRVDGTRMETLSASGLLTSPSVRNVAIRLQIDSMLAGIPGGVVIGVFGNLATDCFR